MKKKRNTVILEEKNGVIPAKTEWVGSSALPWTIKHT